MTTDLSEIIRSPQIVLIFRHRHVIFVFTFCPLIMIILCCFTCVL